MRFTKISVDETCPMSPVHCVWEVVVQGIIKM